MRVPWKLLLTGGGTGGHIYPALAIAARVSRTMAPVEILYVGSSGGMEERLAQDAGLRFVGLPVKGLVRKGPVAKAEGVALLGVACARALGVVRRFRPTVVVGTGGYAAGPVGLAAVLTGTPLVLQEQNVVPGVTNRWLSRFAAAVAVPLPQAAAHFPRSAPLVVTGNPVREDLVRTDRQAARRRLGVAPGERLVVVVAGSRGSAVFVRLLREMLPGWTDGTLLFISGAAHAEAARRIISDHHPRPGAAVRLQPYADNMGEVLAASDLVVCRAGAMALAELAALGRPAILIPSPHVTHHHQEANAAAFAQAGAAVVLPEEGLNGVALGVEVRRLLQHHALLDALGRKARALYRDDALDQIIARITAARQGRTKGGNRR